MFYTSKDGRHIIADHRAQIDRAKARLAKKSSTKIRRQADKLSILNDDLNLVFNIRDEVKNHRHRYSYDKTRTRKR